MKITLYKIWPTIYTGGNYGYTLYKPADPDTIWESVSCELPNGYTVGTNRDGLTMIFDPEDRGCNLRGGKKGEQVRLISDGHSVAVQVQEAQEDE